MQAKEEERTFTIINAAHGLADNSAQVVKCTKTGRIIISTIGNLNFFDGKTFTHADTHPRYEFPLPHYQGHYHLYFDLHHHIWLKDKLKVSCLDLMTENYVENVDSIIKSMGCHDSVLDLFTDQYNEAWFLTEKGLFNPDRNLTVKVRKAANLQDVDCLDGIVYTFYDDGEVIGQDSLGNTVCQLQAYGPERKGKYVDSGVLQPYENGFFQIRNGSQGGILQFFDAKNKTWEIITEQPYHLNNMTFDNDTRKLYIPSEYGYWIYELATKELEHVPGLVLANGQTMRTDCNAMIFDHQGGLWVGTEKRGVLYARPHSVAFRSYPWGNELADKYGTMMNSLQQNITEYDNKKAFCKFEDSRGWTWIGTRKGLCIIRPGRPEQIYTRRTGLNNDVVHSVIEDYDHNVWVATSSGITFFLIRDGEITFLNNFTGDDNVPDESFENCKAMLLPDSSIVMQTVEHVVVFKPSDLHNVNYPHIITNIMPKLIRLRVNGDDVFPNEEYDGNVIVDRAMTRVKHINLKSSQNSVTLTFSALNYYRPMQTYYRVRVNEWDTGWTVFSCQTSSMVDNRGLLHFPMANIEPGDYHVEVQASLFPDAWEEDSPDMKHFVWEIHVKQPWWRTTGLMVLASLALLALLIANFFVYNRNTRMRVRRHAEEGDIIRKIRFFVDRYNSILKEPLSPLTNKAGEEVFDEERVQFQPEFVSLMQKLIPVVTRNQNRSLTMRKLSKAGDIGIVRLYEILVPNINKSPRSLALLNQVHKGAELLTHTEDSIEQVALGCGFYTPNYFMGTFFHEYKQTPDEYRAQKRSQ
jgi:AraC-like DNA-binding protein